MLRKVVVMASAGGNIAHMRSNLSRPVVGLVGMDDSVVSYVA